nr:TonB-dependent receptor [Brevundimonas diminuta]
MTAYRSSLFAGVAALAISSAAHAQPQTPAQINFSIPAGPLGAALNAYASQAGRQLMFTSGQVAGRRTPGLSGRMTADAALDQLLAGSGLIAVQSSSGAWVLQHSPKDQLTEAVVVDDVVVTGTLLRGPGDTPSPVTVIRRDDLDRTGRATVADALAALPQNYAGSGTPTTALVGSDPMQSNSGLATGVNLRGLGPDSTLVLVNGRRMAGAGGRGDFADVSAVPTAAIERVDVLLDGASALYGADAVGGVVNIILRRDFDGQESRLRIGASKGGGESVIAAHTIGRTWSTGQALLSYEFERQNPLSTMDRAYTATGDLRPFGGTDHRTYYGVPGNIVRFDNATSAYVVTHAIRPRADGVARSPADFVAGQQNYDNTRVGATLVPEFDRHAAYLYARQQIGSHLEFTGDLRLSQREFETESLTPTTIATVTTANPHFVSPTGATTHSIAYSFGEDIGASRRSGQARSLGASLGARVFLPADWEAEAFLTYGTERTVDESRGVLQSTYLQEALGNTADNPATVFSAPRDGVRRQRLWHRSGVADNGGIGSRRSDVRNADETQSLQPKIGCQAHQEARRGGGERYSPCHTPAFLGRG